MLSYGQWLPQAIFLKFSLIQDSVFSNSQILDKKKIRKLETNDLHIALPSSKSLSNRWLVLNHLLGRPFALRNLSDSDDTAILQTLLGQLRRGKNSEFFCGNAGTVARFMLAVLAITPGEWTLDGDERLRQRPMGPLIEALRGMGFPIRCLGEEGFLPLHITGYMPPHKMTEIDPSESSQYVSAMLLIGPFLPQGLTLTLTDRAASRPYIDMTLTVLNRAGITTSVSPNRRVYRVNPVQSLTHSNISIERDWSAAAYIYAAAALLPHHRLRMQGLSLSGSCQGDKVTAELFSHFGVTTREVRSPYRKEVRSVTVEGNGTHDTTFEHNFIDCPDLLPPVLITCAALGVKARLKGVKNLRLKESDRLQVLTEELGKMGCRVTQTATELKFFPTNLKPLEPVDDHGDHRIAMAFGILSLRYPDIRLLNPSCVTKSYPTFWEQVELLKAIDN